MRGKKAKALRREARIVANAMNQDDGKLQPRTEHGGGLGWHKWSVQAIYRRMKRGT